MALRINIECEKRYNVSLTVLSNRIILTYLKHKLNNIP